MDLITFGVFFFFFLLCVASVLFISVYGTSEQSFEDGLLSKDGEKKKERKASGKKSDEAGTEVSTVHQRKKPGKFGKKNAEEKESKPVETKPVEPIVPKAKEPEAIKPEVAVVDTHKIVKKDKPTAPEVPAPVKVAKPEEVPVKKVAKEEKRGAKSKILIEEVESDVKVAPVVAPVEEQKPEPKKAVKAKPAEKIETVPEIVKEVAKVEEVVQKAPEVKTVDAPAPKAAKKKSEVPAKSGNAGKLLDPNAIISAVKTVSLEETQVQQLIDILLNKQNNSNTSVNGFGSSDDWSGDKSANQTKRQLTETQTLLEEEKSKTKSLTERLTVLRTELNQTKSAQISAQRMVDEFQTQTQRANATWEGRLKHEIDQRHREVHALQTQVNLHLSQIQQLQGTLESVQQQQQQHHQQQHVDVALVESLRETNAKLEAELSNLQNQLHSAVAQLNEANEVKQRTVAELNQAKEELVAKLAQTTSDVSQKKSKLEELERTCKELQAKVSDVTSAQKATEAENARLTEENVRLSEQQKQQAVVVSTPTKAEKITESFDKSVYLKEQASIAKKWEDFYKDFSPEKSRPSLLELYTNEPAVNGSAVNGDHDSDKKFKIEKILAQGDVMLSGLVGCYCSVKTKLDQVESELSAQKTKNNELREKNWKVVEAMNNAEQKLRKSQSTATPTSQNTAAAAVDVESLKSNTQAEVKKILLSHFPALKVTEFAEFPTWAGQFIERVQEKVRENAATDFKAETETLEKQANHYKAILSETEVTLLKLQEEVESMESGFESKLSEQKTALAEKENKLAQISKEKSSLAEKSAALESKLEESNKRIKELEEKTKTVENSSETESNNQELVQLKSELAKEQKSRAELSEQVAKLNTIVSTNQKALEQEKRITEKLQLQLSERTSAAPISQVSETVENGNSKSPQSENETVTPQSGSIASLEMSDTTSSASPAKSGKSKKKKKNAA